MNPKHLCFKQAPLLEKQLGKRGEIRLTELRISGCGSLTPGCRYSVGNGGVATEEVTPRGYETGCPIRGLVMVTCRRVGQQRPVVPFQSLREGAATAIGWVPRKSLSPESCQAPRTLLMQGHGHRRTKEVPRGGQI